MAKGNKGGSTKEQTERYGDDSQPKHENGWEYKESAPPPSQGTYPQPALGGGGESVHERSSYGSHPDDYDHNDTHRVPE